MDDKERIKQEFITRWSRQLENAKKHQNFDAVRADLIDWLVDESYKKAELAKSKEIFLELDKWFEEVDGYADFSSKIFGEDKPLGYDKFQETYDDLKRKFLKESRSKEYEICRHCNGLISLRNPMGFCDHLYYPENCNACNVREKR